MLKAQTKSVVFISSFNSMKVCFVYFEALLLVYRLLGQLQSLDDMTFYHSEMFYFVPVNTLCAEIPDFF